MLNLLDTTIRDGSYVIDFQFSAHDTTIISARLDDAGIPFIEIGHGLGLGAWRKDEMKSADNDEKYMEAASAAVKVNKWGMFFIPGIGTIEDIELAHKYKIDFIRVGTNVTEIETSKKYIEKAKELGICVFANYMKTYALNAGEVGKMAKQSQEYGADVVCVVDSAGGMMPEDVKNYVSAIRSETEVKIGFHGHNNLGLAIANSLIAIENGAEIIDTSVRGMGRSAGNTVTEIMLFALKRRGYNLNIDVTKILNLAEKIIDPLMHNYKQMDSIAIISGFAQFHSSFLPKIFKFASKYSIDPRELIIRLTMNDKVNAPDELLAKLSKEISSEKTEKTTIKLTTASLKAVNTSESTEQKMEELITRLSSASKKRGKLSVFNIVQRVSPDKQTIIFPSIHENDSFVMASGEFSINDISESTASRLEGRIDYILLDSDNKSQQSTVWTEKITAIFKRTKIIPYSDLQAWAEAISNLLLNLLKSNFSNRKVLIAGDTFLARIVEMNLKTFGTKVKICTGTDTIGNEVYDAVIYCDQSELTVKPHSGIIVIDGIIGSLNDRQIKFYSTAGINIYRPDMTMNTLSKMESMMSSINLVAEKQGLSSINGIAIAAGGIIASKGTVIVDSIKKPAKVFGIANGKGNLLTDEQISSADKFAIQSIEDWILNEALN